MHKRMSPLVKFKFEYFDISFRPSPRPQFNSFYNVIQDKLFKFKDKHIMSFSNSPHTNHPNRGCSTLQFTFQEEHNSLKY